MNHTVNSPIGIDKQIQIIQNYLHNRIGWNDIDVFGRVHKNPSKDNKGLTLEFYTGNNEYKDVFTNDLKSATIFFIDGNEHKIDKGIFTSEVKIVFMVDLKKIKPVITHRADMEIEIEALKEVQKHRMFLVQKMEKGIETVFKGFNTDKIKKNNMQPYHVFAIVGTLKYDITNC